MKRGIKIISLTGLILFLVGLNAAFGQDWSQWRGSNRDGKILGFKAPATWPEKLAQEWKINVGWGDATPALVNGKLYVFTRQEGNEVLQCLDASNGKAVWKESYPANPVTGPAARHPGPRSSPVVVSGKVIVLGATSIISCFDAESGKLIWRNDEYADMVPAYFTAMSPIVIEKMCIAHLGSAEKSAIIAFDVASGRIIWKFEGDGPAYASPDIMTIDNVRQVVLQTDKSLLGLSVDDGKLLWQTPTTPERRFYNSSSPVIDGKRIFITGQGTGSRAITISKKGNDYSVNDLWKNPSLGTTYNTPVLKDGFLFGLSYQGYLYCLNASNGETTWADTTRHRDFGSIIDAESVMIALSSTSNLVVFKPATDAFIPITMIKVADTPIYAHPVVSGNKMYIKDEESLTLYIIK